MKKNLSFGVGMTYAGSFLGAGYVSGQELWKFFGRYGAAGIAGLVLTMLLFFALGTMLFLFCFKTKISILDRVIIADGNKTVLTVVSSVQMIFFICVYLLMSAGVGSLFETCFGVSKYISTAVFCAVITVLTAGGIDRMIKVFSFTVPFLAVAAVMFSIVFLAKNGFMIDWNIQSMGRYKFGWLFSSLVYMSYNFFGVIGIMAPVNAKINSIKTGITGILTGVVMLFAIAFSVLAALRSAPVYSQFELPMLNLSFSLGNVFGYIYALLLFLSMAGTSFSCLIAADNYLLEKSRTYKSKHILFLTLISLICYLCSLYGFGNLISTIYPLFGYIGFAVIVLFVVNFFRVSKKTD